MPIRVYSCDHCKTISSITFESGTSPRCACGSQNLRTVKLAPTNAPPSIPTAMPVAPSGPSIPTPPPLPPMGGGASRPAHPAHEKFLKQQGNAKPSGKGLLYEIQHSKVGVLDPSTGARVVNRQVMDQRAYDRYWTQAMDALPAQDNTVVGTQAEVKRVVRCIVDRVRRKTVPNIRIGFLLGGRLAYLPGRFTVDLTLPLTEMAAGRCRPLEHARANTQFRNLDQILPRQVAGRPVTYLEFGWRFNVPPSVIRTNRNNATGQVYTYVEVQEENGVTCNFGRQQAAYTAINNSRGTVDAGLRLVVSDWGHLFFTATHYETFFIYSPAMNDEQSNDGWKSYNTTVTASASNCDRGEMSAARQMPGRGLADRMLPVSAPGYW